MEQTRIGLHRIGKYIRHEQFRGKKSTEIRAPDGNRPRDRGNNFFIKIRRHNSRPCARSHNNWPPSKAERHCDRPATISMFHHPRVPVIRSTLGNRYRGPTKIEAPCWANVFESTSNRRKRRVYRDGEIFLRN